MLEKSLLAACEGVGVPLGNNQIAQCLHFADRLLTTNETMNLTRITDPDAVAVRHFADSLTLLTHVSLSLGASVMDVGTGAGFPGMVLKIARPDLQITLLDSLAKRLAFLESVAEDLEFTNLEFLHARAEEAGRLAQHRDSYDMVTARAVAALPTLLEWCAPLVKVGGQFVAMKSDNADGEIAAGDTARRLLKLASPRVLSLMLPVVGSEAPSSRRLILYKKIAVTPVKYPRSTAEIKGKPLRAG